MEQPADICRWLKDGVGRTIPSTSVMAWGTTAPTSAPVPWKARLGCRNLGIGGMEYTSGSCASSSEMMMHMMVMEFGRKGFSRRHCRRDQGNRSSEGGRHGGGEKAIQKARKCAERNLETPLAASRSCDYCDCCGDEGPISAVCSDCRRDVCGRCVCVERGKCLLTKHCEDCCLVRTYYRDP
jgi:hypothetical protein